MNVGELIASLSELPASDYLRIDRSPVELSVSELGSYRGFYEDLAIAVEPARHGKICTVGDFLALLRAAVGSTIYGYKGGEYTVRESTRVWISNYGECSGALVTGARREEWGCTFITWRKDNET